MKQNETRGARTWANSNVGEVTTRRVWTREREDRVAFLFPPRGENSNQTLGSWRQNHPHRARAFKGVLPFSQLVLSYPPTATEYRTVRGTVQPLRQYPWCTVICSDIRDNIEPTWCPARGSNYNRDKLSRVCVYTRWFVVKKCVPRTISVILPSRYGVRTIYPAWYTVPRNSITVGRREIKMI